MNEQIGQQFGSYRLIRLLGRGSFADVYLGEHTYLKTLAAIKILQVRLSEANLEDFLKEARTIAHLEHPNIVRVLDFGVKDRIPFLVMNYAPNGTLRERHPQGSILPLPTIVAYVKGIASALQYAHNEKLMHRDVKPENMLLGRNNEVLLSDFGIALVTQSTPHQSAPGVIGTVAYMAPEQIQGKPGPASDQYALAIVVYEWLGGYRPFKGGFTELCAQHMQAPPPPLRERIPMISPALEAVIMRALAKDPKARFANVQVFATALEQAYQAQTMEESGPTLPATSFPSSPITAGPTRPSIPEYEDVPAYPPRYATYSSNPASDDTVIIDTNKQQAKSSSTIPPTYPILTPPVPAASLADKRDTHDYPFKPTTTTGRKAMTKRNIILLVALVVLVLGGGVGFLIVNPGCHFRSCPQLPPPPSTNSPMFGFNPQHTHYNSQENIITPANVFRLLQSWTGTTGDNIESSPIVADGILYVGSYDSYLYAYDAKTGRRLWKTPTTLGSQIFSTPAVADGVVYVGSEDFNLYAFNAKTGMLIWKAPTNNLIESSPVVVNHVVYIGSDDHNLYAFNARTGAVLWQASVGQSALSSPAVAHGVVYIGSFDGSLYAFNAGGCGKPSCTPLWTAPTGGHIVFSSPAVAYGKVYIGSGDHNLYAFNADGCGSGNTICQYVWKALAGGNISSSPAAAYGKVYVGSDDHNLYAFNADGCGSGNTICQYVWKSTSVRSSIFSSPMVANGVVYVGSVDSIIYAFNANGCGSGKTSCQYIWHATTGGEVYSSPAVVDGMLYVGSNDHSLYAFMLSGT